MPSDPRRYRMWLRPRNFILAMLLLLAAAVAWVGSEVYWACTVEPGHPIDYAAKMRELVAASQAGAAGEDAWPILQDAFAIEDKARQGAMGRYGDAPEGRGFSWPTDYEAVRRTDLPEALRRQSEQLIADLRSAGLFDLEARIAAAGRLAWPVPDGSLLDIMMPEIGMSRNLARLGAARMYIADRESNGPEQAAAFEQTLGLGRVTAMNPTLIAHLVGIAIESLAMREMRCEVTSKAPDEATLRAMIRALERQTPLTGLATHVQAERIFCLDVLQGMHSDDGHGGGRFLPYQAANGGFFTGGSVLQKSPLSKTRLMNLEGIVMPRKAQAAAVINAYFDSIARAADAPAGRRSIAGNAAASVRFKYLEALVPSIGKYFLSCDHHEAEVRGTRLLLTVELYRAERGGYPGSLADLMPECIKELPVEPISGMAFVYRRLGAGEDKDGRGYLLYGCGADEKDDGGKAARGAFGTNPSASAGSDWVLNQAREVQGEEAKP